MTVTMTGPHPSDLFIPSVATISSVQGCPTTPRVVPELISYRGQVHIPITPGDSTGVWVVCTEQRIANSNHPARRKAFRRTGDCLGVSRTPMHKTVGEGRPRWIG